MGDLDDRLHEWGESEVPHVDGAFANRLEGSLRERMIDSEERTGVVAWFVRPGVLVVGAVLLIAGLAVGLRTVGTSEVGVANDETGSTVPQTTAVETTVPITAATTGPTTSVAAGPTVTTVVDQTTIPPDSTAPETTAPETTAAPVTTVPATSSIAPPPSPLPITEVSALQVGRQITVSWRVDTTNTDVAGWVLLVTVDGRTDVLELSRDPATRQFEATIPGVDADYRIEGRTVEGDVVFDSGEILFSPDE